MILIGSAANVMLSGTENLSGSYTTGTDGGARVVGKSSLYTAIIQNSGRKEADIPLSLVALCVWTAITSTIKRRRYG